MSSSLSTRRGGICAAAATLCEVKYLFRIRRGVLGADDHLEGLRRNMMISFLKDCYEYCIVEEEPVVMLYSRDSRKQADFLYILVDRTDEEVS